jgi:hypothetical protein
MKNKILLGSTLTGLVLTFIHPSFAKESLARPTAASSLVASDLETAQVAWDPARFTDPTQHDPQHFLYIVHATKDYSLLESVKSYIELANGHLYTAPDGRVSGHKVLSASVISDSKNKTYAPFGFILQVPSSLIVVAQWHDTGVYNYPFGSLAAIEEMLKKRYGLPASPEEVLKETQNYNEVDILLPQRAPGYEPVRPRVSGIFVRANVDASEKQLFQQFAQQSRLPFVELP